MESFYAKKDFPSFSTRISHHENLQFMWEWLQNEKGFIKHYNSRKKKKNVIAQH